MCYLLPQDLTFVGTTIVRQDRIGTFPEDIDDCFDPLMFIFGTIES